MNAVLISINPKWCGLIARGAKTDNIALSYEYSTKDVAIEAWNRRDVE